MTDKELNLCKELGAEIVKIRKQANDEDFITNEEQMQKFSVVEAFARKLAEDHGGTIEAYNVKPSDTIGAIAIRFIGEVTFGECMLSIQEFTNVIGLCDGLRIEGTGLDDGSFIITFYVDDIHVERPKCKIIKLN